MIKIAICDDEELFRSEMEKFVSVYGNESDTEIEIDTYESASQMVKEIHDSGKRYDILFTDIEMPGLDGMEAAMALREMGGNSGNLFCHKSRGIRTEFISG